MTAPRRDGGSDPVDQAERIESLIAQYRSAGQPFALVTVVRREAPVSANVGDRAIVTPDGELIGWIGGADCAQSVARKEAMAALERDEPRLIGLAPDPDDVARPGVEAYPMTCHSGGTLELFVEPVLTQPRVVVIGDSPIARELARFADETEFGVTLVTEDDSTEYSGVDETLPVSAHDRVVQAIEGATAVVIASVGAYDEAGLLAALRADAAYVGLVASDKRQRELAETVADRLDVEPAVVRERVTSPAGLDIGAKTPSEIAVSILAELIAVRRGAREVSEPAPIDASDWQTEGEQHEHEATAENEHNMTTEAHQHDAGQHGSPADAETVVDPVCGMDVVVEDAAATATHEGEVYHFCGAGCAEAFESEPERYLDEVAGSD